MKGTEQMKKLLTATVFALALALPAWAGDIQTTGDEPPPPPEPTQSSTSTNSSFDWLLMFDILF
jgi:hypothetical protein